MVLLNLTTKLHSVLLYNNPFENTHVLEIPKACPSLRLRAMLAEVQNEYSVVRHALGHLFEGTIVLPYPRHCLLSRCSLNSHLLVLSGGVFFK